MHIASSKEVNIAGDGALIGLLGTRPGAPFGGLQNRLKILRFQFWRSMWKSPWPRKALSSTMPCLAKLRLANLMARKIIAYAKIYFWGGRLPSMIVYNWGWNSYMGSSPHLRLSPLGGGGVRTFVSTLLWTLWATLTSTLLACECIQLFLICFVVYVWV